MDIVKKFKDYFGDNIISTDERFLALGVSTHTGLSKIGDFTDDEGFVDFMFVDNDLDKGLAVLDEDTAYSMTYIRDAVYILDSPQYKLEERKEIYDEEIGPRKSTILHIRGGDYVISIGPLIDKETNLFKDSDWNVCDFKDVIQKSASSVLVF